MDQAYTSTVTPSAPLIPVEVCCSAPPSDRTALKCLIRRYITENLIHLIQSKGNPEGRSLDRCSLLIPILPTAARPLQLCVKSLRLGDYGPLSALYAYAEGRREGDEKISGVDSEAEQQRIEDALFFDHPPQSETAHESISALHTCHPVPDTDKEELRENLNAPTYDILFFDLHDDTVKESVGTNPRTRDGDAALESAVRVQPLPNASVEGLWESLLYGDTIEASHTFKRELLQYMQTSLLFAKVAVDPHLIQWNRLLLFYGPPGSGKTSLCKALAQKLSIVLRSVFPRAVFAEIQSQNVFSRWFSESGKQVAQVFSHLRYLAEDPQCLVCVLMDEVESLVTARKSAMQGNEPSDALRVVNAILTQLDELQRYPNVLLVTTSNLMHVMDDAFLDRADKKVFVGPPGRTARRYIIRSSTSTLLQKRLLSWPMAVGGMNDVLSAVSTLLHEIASKTVGCSGRFLRRVPFLAFSQAAFLVGRSETEKDTAMPQVDVLHYLQLILSLVREECDTQARICGGKRSRE